MSAGFMCAFMAIAMTRKMEGGNVVFFFTNNISWGVFCISLLISFSISLFLSFSLDVREGMYSNMENIKETPQRIMRNKVLNKDIDWSKFLKNNG